MIMKKTFATLLFCCVSSMQALAQQANKPVCIVFPSDKWMIESGLAEKVDNDGVTEYIPQYKLAANNNEMKRGVNAATKVLNDRGFETKQLFALTQRASSQRAMDLAKSAAGKGTRKDAIDDLLQQARPDIKIELDVTVTHMGPMINVSFEMAAVDAYTSQQIALCQGKVDGVTDLETNLRQMIAGKSEEFCEQMVSYFMDLKENGRKINVIFNVDANSSIDFLETEVGDNGDVYEDFLFDWVSKKAINNAANRGVSTSNRLEINDVRIPFYDEATGRPIDAKQWARPITQEIRNALGVKVVREAGGGLGEVSFRVDAQ